MIVVYSSDLHGNKELYEELLELAEKRKAQAVIIGGDLLPIHGPFQYSLQEQEEFIFSFIEPRFRDFLSRVDQAAIFAMLGNDDWQESSVHLKKLADESVVRLLHLQKHDLGNIYTVSGYSHVPPTPFTIKDGERRDLQEDVVEGQRCTACLSQHGKITVVDTHRYFMSTKSIEAELQELPEVADYGKAVYVMHSPPFHTHLDRLFDGRWIGSRAIRKFIERNQPYLTLHGHIHESSEISGQYWDWIGKTICINPGQSSQELYAVVFELENIAATLEHTVFGQMSGNA
jgi:Icc-related predicted phosphoesterase